jgi:hypothetical protein
MFRILTMSKEGALRITGNSAAAGHALSLTQMGETVQTCFQQLLPPGLPTAL